MNKAKEEIMSMSAKAFVREFITDARITNAIYKDKRGWTVATVYRRGEDIPNMGKRSLGIFRKRVDHVIEEISERDGLDPESFTYLLDVHWGVKEDSFHERVPIEDLYQAFKRRMRADAGRLNGVKQLTIEDQADSMDDLYKELKVRLEKDYGKQIIKDMIGEDSMIDLLKEEDKKHKESLYLEGERIKTEELRKITEALSLLYDMRIRWYASKNGLEYTVRLHGGKNMHFNISLSLWEIYHAVNEEILKDKGVIA